MGNYIKVAVMNSIITLYERGWSQRKIARELDLDRETVQRNIRLKRLGGSKPAIPTPGNPSPGSSKPAIPTAGKFGRKSQCEPYRGQIEEKFSQGLSGQRISQNLRSEQDFPGSAQTVKRSNRATPSIQGSPYNNLNNQKIT